MHKKMVVLILLFAATLHVLGQAGNPSDAKNISVDLVKYAFSAPFPYDKPINLTGNVDVAVTSMELFIHPGNFKKGEQLPSESSVATWDKDGTNTFFNFQIDVLPETKKYLEAGHYYALEIVGRNKEGNIAIDFRYIINTTTSAADQVKMDFGVLYADQPKMFSGEIAAHFYLVPVNDEADPVHFKGISQNIFKRTSLYFGLSIAKFSSETKQDVKNFVGIGNLVYGVSVHSPLYGWYGRRQVFRRFLQPMYFNFGEILFKQADANPLIVKDRNKRAFYVGVSYDFNFTTLISPLLKLFTP